MSELTLQRAWRAYYTVLATDPDATPEQRDRGNEMLAKTPLYQRAIDADREPEVDELA